MLSRGIQYCNLRPPCAFETPQRPAETELTAAESGEKLRNKKICRVTGKDFGSALLLNGDRNLTEQAAIEIFLANAKRQRLASTEQAAIEIFLANQVHPWLELPGSALLLNGERNLERQRVASTEQAAIDFFLAYQVHQWLDLPSLGSLFSTSKPISASIRDTPKKVSYDMTELNAVRLFLCERCYVTGYFMEKYINDFLQRCKTRKIFYEKLGFQVLFEEPFEFVPFYLESGVNSLSIIKFYYNFPEARPYLDTRSRMYLPSLVEQEEMMMMMEEILVERDGLRLN